MSIRDTKQFLWEVCSVEKMQKFSEQSQLMNFWHCIKDVGSLYIHLGCDSLCEKLSETYKVFNSHLQSIWSA